jgi:transcriptional regulator of NAD metabolism
METWKPVLGFEDLYEVSDHGNARRTARSKIVDAAKVPEVKRMFERGATLKEVAAFLNVSIPTAHSIKLGKTWAGDAKHRPLALQPIKHYLTVNMCQNGMYFRRSVHRLVWEAFNGPIPGRLEVNHKDLDRANNRLDNLELLTHRENVNHAHAIYAAERAHLPKGQRRGPRSKYAKIQHT